MKNTLVVLAVLVFTLGFTSCKKKGCINEKATNYDANAQKDDESCVFGDTTKPVITIKDPSMAMYIMDITTMSAIIPISVTVTDNEGLHSVAVVLTNTTSGVEVLHIHLHPDDASVSIDSSYTATMAHQDYVLSVVAEDHTENAATSEAHTHVHMN